MDKLDSLGAIIIGVSIIVILILISYNDFCQKSGKPISKQSKGVYLSCIFAILIGAALYSYGTLMRILQ